MKKAIPTIIIVCLLMAACGQSYEETKRIARENRKETLRKNEAALKIAVMPTLDCLPLYVARHYQLLDTIYGGVQLRPYRAQMDCDTALERGHVEGMVTDLVRAMRLHRRGVKMRYVAATNAHWQLITNRNARIRKLKQLDDKMVAMTRFSSTDLLSDEAIDSAKLSDDRVFKVQINDVRIRLQMLMNNEMDALWLTEPQATEARLMKHHVVMDSRTMDLRLGVIAFREKEMQHPNRAKQLSLFLKAYDQACDSINKYGIGHYRRLLTDYYKVKQTVVDSLPPQPKYEHARGPRQQDVAVVEKWLDKEKKENGR